MDRILCWRPCLILVLVWAGVLYSSEASAAEFYSWIDPSGTTVMTDDPGRIPPATERSRITVHRFRDTDRVTDQVRLTLRSSAQDQIDSKSEPVLSRQSDTVLSVDPTELLDALLDVPEDRLKPQYTWVPLSGSLLIGSRAVSGFWWRAGAMPAKDAFKAFLRQPVRRLWHEQRHPWADSLSWNSIPRSGNATYDQVFRERQALIQQTVPHGTSSPDVSQLCCGAGRAGISGGRGAGQ